MAVKTIAPSADARETWRTVNVLIAEVAQLQALVARQNATIEALQRRPLGGDGGELRVYLCGDGVNEAGFYLLQGSRDPDQTP